VIGSPLLARLAYLSGLSTAPSTLDVDLAAAVMRAEGQRAGAHHAGQVRCERIYAAVRAEGGMLAPTMALARRVAIVRRGIGNRLEAHDLGRVPSERVVRAGLRKLDAERKAVVSPETTT